MTKCCHVDTSHDGTGLYCDYCSANAEQNRALPPGLALHGRLTLEDLTNLGKAFETSMQPRPGLVIDLWESARRMLQYVLLPDLQRSVQFGIMTEPGLCHELEVDRWYAAMCALACFGIGVEESRRSLVNLEAGDSVRQICFALGKHVICPLLLSAHRGHITEEQALDRGRRTLDQIHTWGTGMWGRGLVEGAR
jgi:hypothetical protein